MIDQRHDTTNDFHGPSLMYSDIEVIDIVVVDADAAAAAVAAVACELGICARSGC